MGMRRAIGHYATGKRLNSLGFNRLMRESGLLSVCTASQQAHSGASKFMDITELDLLFQRTVRLHPDGSSGEAKEPKLVSAAATLMGAKNDAGGSTKLGGLLKQANALTKQNAAAELRLAAGAHELLAQAEVSRASEAELREAEEVQCINKSLSEADLATLAALGSELPALGILLLQETSGSAGPDGVSRLAEGLVAGSLPAVTRLLVGGMHVGVAGKHEVGPDRR